MKFYFVAVLILFSLKGKAQLSFDSLPPVSGLSDLLISGPFICPDAEQPIKFPKQFYKESKSEQILKISKGEMEKGISCISEKKELSYYREPKHYCEWMWGLDYLGHQCNKWKKAGSYGVLPVIKKQFYEKLMAADCPIEFYVPDLTFNYFYLNKDSIPDFIVYDGSDGTDPRTIFIEYKKDSINFIKSIYGYAYDVRKASDGLLVLTRWGIEERGAFECHSTYAVRFKNEKIKITDSVIIASGKGLRLPSYTMDKKFRTKDVVVVGKIEQNEDSQQEIFPQNSFGYVLGEFKGLYFVAMLNNLPTEKNIFRNYIEERLKKKVGTFYTLGWVEKSMVRFD
ncbi:MAG: hypothetical protein IAF38_14670 [Bacteroidia bacterium]|nr:hypothetical protein [Bacteroidia bacterium]